MDKIVDFIEHNVYNLDPNDIIERGKRDVSIFNVVRRINKECYSVELSQEDDYLLAYIYTDPITDKICGVLLNLGKSLIDLEKKVFEYAKYITTLTNVDLIDTYNTYCIYLRSILEHQGYMTFTSEDVKYMKSLDQHSFVASKQPIVFIQTIDKREFYKGFFKDNVCDMENITDDKVYLMYDFKTNLTKIGYSITPTYRERTLQGEKPTIELLTYWIAPKRVEKELHNKFKDKRERGEWFKLSFDDFLTIKNYMKVY